MMEKYCFIQIDMDDNQWIVPRLQNLSYNISRSDFFLKAIENIEKNLSSYPLTLFLVGSDMKVDKKVSKIKNLLQKRSEIEIANHSLHHCNNFNCLPYEEKQKEIMESDKIIKDSLNLNRIHGFRSPGFIFNNEIVDILKDGNYVYDASLLPTYFAPLLRKLSRRIYKIPCNDNFGNFKNGFMPNEPMLLDKKKKFFEINVSVCPFLRIPIHYSIIKNKNIYGILSGFINNLKYLNFIFHLYDFIDIDLIKLKYVLNLITHQRKLALSKNINDIYKN